MTKDQVIAPKVILDELLEHCTPYSGHHERYHIVLRHLRASLAPAPDCRTCIFHSVDQTEGDHWCHKSISITKCTNGDQYTSAPAVVLWRTPC